MLHTTGIYEGYTETLEKDIILSFSVAKEVLSDYLNRLEGQKVVLEAKKYNEKRSLNANNYLWKLCDLIAAAIGSDKDSVYQMELSRYGVFEDIECAAESKERVKSLFKYAEELYEDYIGGDGKVTIRGYIGSSSYDTKEMSVLINGVVNDCKELNIETWPPDEIDRLLKEWNGNE